MVKKFYRTIDGCEFTDGADAAAHEVVLRKKEYWASQLSSLGLDAAGVGIVLQNAFKVYQILQSGFKDLYAEDDEDE